MPKRKDILGKKYGKLTPLEELEKERGMRKWRMQCDCGNIIDVLQKVFACGNKRSCGCIVRTTMKHNMSTTPEYRAWVNMKSRCTNDNTPGFENYGGRGITVHPEWKDDFEAFLRDVGKRPTPAHSLDRVDVNGNYAPGNVRWATQTQQMRNVRNNRYVEIDGNASTLAEAAELSPIPYNTILYRLRRGWSIQDAISRPPHKGLRP